MMNSGKFNDSNKKCTTVDISLKNLNQFPSLKLSNIQFLYLENNKIKELPPYLFLDAPNLCWLDLRNNCIENIPESIEHHASIETMLLQHNRIINLPLSLGLVKSLKTIQLRGNPLIFPKKHIVDSGTESMLCYLYGEYKKSKNHTDDIDLSTIQSEHMYIENNNNSGNTYKKRKTLDTKKSTSNIKINNNINISQNNSFNNNFFLKKVKAITSKPKVDQEKIIQQNIQTDMSNFIMREILIKREKALQNQKSLETLKNWRIKYKNNQILNKNLHYTLDLSNLPFDTNLNFVKILTRAEIGGDLPDKYKKNILNKQKKVFLKREKPNIDMKINNIIDTINYSKSDCYDLTPRSERRMIINKIKKLTELKEEIKKLKIENKNIL